ncbi:hypothetical protein ILYODFUR_006853 [Ilyodon furcidens]|uniref:Uncharacterized protein n=1 Tax=Ilyodon furcidens TaxID=33524 RepID=A0ABV0SJ54_9TELE
MSTNVTTGPSTNSSPSSWRAPQWVGPDLLPGFCRAERHADEGVQPFDSASGLHSSSANHPSRLRFKTPSYAESPAFQLSFDPPPPHLHHQASSFFRLPYLLRPPLHHQSQDPGGKTSLILTLRCSFKLMSLSAPCLPPGSERRKETNIS